MKFKLNEKLKYMAFGALLALAGFVFGNLNKGIDAQSEQRMVDKLTVRKLTVLDTILVKNEVGNDAVIIGANDGKGTIITSGEDVRKVYLGFFGKWAGMFTSAGESRGHALLGVFENGDGKVEIHANQGEGKAKLFVKDGNGEAMVTTKGGNGTVLGVKNGKGTLTPTTEKVQITIETTESVPVQGYRRVR